MSNSQPQYDKGTASGIPLNPSVPSASASLAPAPAPSHPAPPSSSSKHEKKKPATTVKQPRKSDQSWRKAIPAKPYTQLQGPDHLLASVLPEGFPPELAFRALASYSLLRTLSTQLRLSPFTPNVFLRSLLLPYPSRLLGQIHVCLLRALFPYLDEGYSYKSRGGRSMSKKRRVDAEQIPLRAGDNLTYLDGHTWPVFYDDYVNLTADALWSAMNDTELNVDMRNIALRHFEEDVDRMIQPIVQQPPQYPQQQQFPHKRQHESLQDGREQDPSDSTPGGAARGRRGRALLPTRRNKTLIKQTVTKKKRSSLSRPSAQDSDSDNNSDSDDVDDGEIELEQDDEFVESEDDEDDDEDFIEKKTVKRNNKRRKRNLPLFSKKAATTKTVAQQQRRNRAAGAVTPVARKITKPQKRLTPGSRVLEVSSANGHHVVQQKIAPKQPNVPWAGGNIQAGLLYGVPPPRMLGPTGIPVHSTTMPRSISSTQQPQQKPLPGSRVLEVTKISPTNLPLMIPLPPPSTMMAPMQQPFQRISTTPATTTMPTMPTTGTISMALSTSASTACTTGTTSTTTAAATAKKPQETSTTATKEPEKAQTKTISPAQPTSVLPQQSPSIVAPLPTTTEDTASGLTEQMALPGPLPNHPRQLSSDIPKTAKVNSSTPQAPSVQQQPPTAPAQDQPPQQSSDVAKTAKVNLSTPQAPSVQQQPPTAPAQDQPPQQSSDVPKTAKVNPSESQSPPVQQQPQTAPAQDQPPQQRSDVPKTGKVNPSKPQAPPMQHSPTAPVQDQPTQQSGDVPKTAKVNPSESQSPSVQHPWAAPAQCAQDGNSVPTVGVPEKRKCVNKLKEKEKEKIPSPRQVEPPRKKRAMFRLPTKSSRQQSPKTTETMTSTASLPARGPYQQQPLMSQMPKPATRKIQNPINTKNFGGMQQINKGIEPPAKKASPPKGRAPIPFSMQMKGPSSKPMYVARPLPKTTYAAPILNRPPPPNQNMPFWNRNRESLPNQFNSGNQRTAFWGSANTPSREYEVETDIADMLQKFVAGIYVPPSKTSKSKVDSKASHTASEQLKSESVNESAKMPSNPAALPATIPTSSNISPTKAVQNDGSDHVKSKRMGLNSLNQNSQIGAEQQTETTEDLNEQISVDPNCVQSDGKEKEQNVHDGSTQTESSTNINSMTSKNVNMVSLQKNTVVDGKDASVKTEVNENALHDRQKVEKMESNIVDTESSSENEHPDENDDDDDDELWPQFEPLDHLRRGVPYHRLPIEQKLIMLEFLLDEILTVDIISAEFTRRRVSVGCYDIPYTALPTEKELETLENADECGVCGLEGELLCCDGCIASYHRKCINLAMGRNLPEGKWLCPDCKILDPAKFGSLRGGKKDTVDWFSLKDIKEATRMKERSLMVSVGIPSITPGNSSSSLPYSAAHQYPVHPLQNFSAPAGLPNSLAAGMHTRQFDALHMPGNVQASVMGNGIIPSINGPIPSVAGANGGTSLTLNSSESGNNLPNDAKNSNEQNIISVTGKSAPTAHDEFNGVELLIVHGFVFTRKQADWGDATFANKEFCVKDLETMDSCVVPLSQGKTMNLLTKIGSNLCSKWPIAQIPRNPQIVWKCQEFTPELAFYERYFHTIDTFDPSHYQNVYRMAPLLASKKQCPGSQLSYLVNSEYETECSTPSLNSLTTMLSRDMSFDTSLAEELRLGIHLYNPYQLFIRYMIKLERGLKHASLLYEKWGLRNKDLEPDMWLKNVEKCRSISRLAALLVGLIDATNQRAFNEEWYKLPGSSTGKSEEVPDHRNFLPLPSDWTPAREAKKRKLERSSYSNIRGLFVSDFTRLEGAFAKYKFAGSKSVGSSRRKRKQGMSILQLNEVVPALKDESKQQETCASTTVPLVKDAKVTQVVEPQKDKLVSPIPSCSVSLAADVRQEVKQVIDNLIDRVVEANHSEASKSCDPTEKKPTKSRKKSESTGGARRSRRSGRLQRKSDVHGQIGSLVSGGAEKFTGSDISRAVGEETKASSGIQAQILAERNKKISQLEELLKVQFDKDIHWPVAGRILFEPVGSISPREMKRLGRHAGSLAAPHLVYNNAYEVGQAAVCHIWRKNTLECKSFEQLLMQIRILQSFINNSSVTAFEHLSRRSAKVVSNLQKTVRCRLRDPETGTTHYFLVNKSKHRGCWVTEESIDASGLIGELSIRRDAEKKKFDDRVRERERKQKEKAKKAAAMQRAEMMKKKAAAKAAANAKAAAKAAANAKAAALAVRPGLATANHREPTKPVPPPRNPAGNLTTSNQHNAAKSKHMQELEKSIDLVLNQHKREIKQMLSNYSKNLPDMVKNLRERHMQQLQQISAIGEKFGYGLIGDRELRDKLSRAEMDAFGKSTGQNHAQQIQTSRAPPQSNPQQTAPPPTTRTQVAHYQIASEQRTPQQPPSHHRKRAHQQGPPPQRGLSQRGVPQRTSDNGANAINRGMTPIDGNHRSQQTNQNSIRGNQQLYPEGHNQNSLQANAWMSSLQPITSTATQQVGPGTNMAIPGAAHLLQAIQAQQPSALVGQNFQLGQSGTLQSLQTQYGNSISPLLGQIQLTNPDQQLAAQQFSPSSATPAAQAMGLLNQLTGNNSAYGTQQQTQYVMGTPQQSPYLAQQLLARQGVQHGNLQGNFGNVISSPSPFASTAVNNGRMQMQPSQQGGQSQDASAAFMDLEPRPIEDILNHGTRR